jgi:RNA polymerase sigma-70 factor (ECF subfamily)
MVRYAYGIVGHRMVAEDIAQEVLLWVWDHRVSLQVRGTVRSYLLTAVRNRALNYMAHHRAELRWEAQYTREDILPGMSHPERAPDDLAHIEALRAAMTRAIAALPERRRQILLLRREHLSHAEIAQVMGISLKTVEAQLTSAFVTLRDALSSWRR